MNCVLLRIGIALLSLAAGSVLGEEDEVRTFEIAAFRTRVLSVDENVLFDWSLDDYLAALTKEKTVDGEGSLTGVVEWVAPYDGLVWGRDEENVAGQWYNRTAERADPVWRFFDRAGDGPTTFPASTRLMGATDRFVWHGWADVAIDIYLPKHRAENPAVWTSLKLVQEMFLFTKSPDEAFDRYAVRGRVGATDDTTETLSNGIIRRKRTFQAAESNLQYVLVTDFEDDKATSPHGWRLVRKNRRTGRSLVFAAQARELTANRRRKLPKTPSAILQIHSDVDRISRVGVRDRSGLGLWDYPHVQYLSASPTIRINDWFESDSGRWLTNLAILTILLGLLWREHSLHERMTQ